MTEPTSPGVPATPVSADVPADETAPAPPGTTASGPLTPPVVGAGEAAPAVPATPAVPPAAAAPPAAPPAAPAAPAAAPAPVPAPQPAVPPAAPAAAPPAAAAQPAPAAPAQPTGTLDAGLSAAAAGSTEVAPHPSVPVSGDPDDAAPGRRRSGGRGVLVGALAAAVPLLAVGALLYTRGPLADARGAQRLADRRTDALNETRQLALNLVSIDYKTLDRDLQRIAESTTGKAREEFDQKILQNQSYKQLVRDNEAVITSKIERIGLEPCGDDDAECRRGDKAVVLVFLDQESRNKLRKQARVDRNRVALTVVRRGDKWLVSEVKVV